VLPLGKGALHVPTELAQLRPVGLLVTCPEPVPRKVRVILGPEPPPPPPPVPPPVKQTRLPVIYPVTMAPFEETPPELVLVLTVADTKVLPQD
jgi:hypothetical protein